MIEDTEEHTLQESRPVASARCEYFITSEEFEHETVHCPGVGDVAAYCAPAPGKLAENEDAAAIVCPSTDSVVLAVADGVGGQPEGQHASGLAVDQLCSAVLAMGGEPDALREAILTGFDRGNRAVIGLGNEAATTMVAVEIHGNWMRTYNVGDSGVLVFGQRGKLKLQTIAHSPVGYALEAGVLDERDAMEHDERHVVSNVLGDPSMHVGMSSRLALRPRDTVVVASDGLFDNLYTHEIIEMLRSGKLTDGVDAVVQECQYRMAQPGEAHPSKPDDLSIVAFRRAKPSPPGQSPLPRDGGEGWVRGQNRPERLG